MDPSVAFQFPDPIPGCVCVVCSRLGVSINQRSVEPDPVFLTYRLVKVLPDNTQQELSEEEVKEFERKFPKLAEWNLPTNQTLWYKTCTKLLEQIVKDKWAGPFKFPVDPVALQILDYPDVVKHPMDFNTIKTKLKAGEYSHPSQFISDMRLVFRNAYVYNKPTTDVWKMAERLSMNFEMELANLRIAPAPA
jgi:hypothetical protein